MGRNEKITGTCDVCDGPVDLDKGWVEVRVTGTGDVYLPLNATDGKAQLRLICSVCATTKVFPLLNLSRGR